MDRILSATATDEASTHNDDGSADDVFTVGDDALWAVLELGPDAWHIADLPNAYEVSRADLDDAAQEPASDEAEVIWVRVPGTDLAWLRRLVLAHACDVRVIAPVELAQDVAHHAKKALTAYDSQYHRHKE